MWPFRSKKKPSQRTAPAPSGRDWWGRFRAAGGLGSVLLAGGFFAAALIMDVSPLEPMPYRLGGYVPHDVYARISFRVVSEERTRRERELAAERTPAVIVQDEAALGQVLAELKGLPRALKSATQPADLAEPIRSRFLIQSPADLKDLESLATPAGAEAYQAAIERVKDKLLSRCVVSKEDFKVAHGRLAQNVVVRVGGMDRAVPVNRLISLGNPAEWNGLLEEATGVLPEPIKRHVRHYLEELFKAGTPLYRLDEEATRQAAERARAAVGPVYEEIAAGKRLVARTTRGGLRRADWEKLLAEHTAYLADQNARHPWRPVRILLGRALLIAGIVVLLCLYVSKYKPRVVKNHWRGLALAALLALMLLLGKVMVGLGGYPYLAVFGIFLASAILTIAYDQRFAFAVAGALVLLTALQLRFGIGELLVLWSAAAAVVFQLREVRTRSKLIETGGITAVVVFLATWAAGSARDVPVGFLLRDGGTAALAAIAGGFIAQGILPLIERVFHIATSLTLLEWCDANKPLLKRLALEAPGTYSHSLLLGSMCEAAAEAIGARGLLARVGAYYHDVGKINKPDYFAENQPGPGSKHDRLSPAMSLLIVKGHVKDGLELAKQYGLPRVLHEFIASHHGTTLVEYFYHAAAEQRKENADRAPEEVEFRYPGPKPRSKEAAILMLADAAESAVRALPDPARGRIETQVHQVVSKRLTDGQLDECDLSLQEVHAIETSLIKSLVSISHARVRYPSQDRGQAGQNGRPEERDKTAAPAPTSNPARR